MPGLAVLALKILGVEVRSLSSLEVDPNFVWFWCLQCCMFAVVPRE